MAIVRRTRITVDEAGVEDADGFTPEVALGHAKGKDLWQPVSDELTYEIRDGEQVYQLAGRAPKEKGA